MKRQVAKLYKNNRSIKSLKTQTSIAFNGGSIKTNSGETHLVTGVEASVLGYINHSIKENVKAAETQREILETQPGFNGFWKYSNVSSYENLINYGGGWDPREINDELEWNLGSTCHHL